MTEQEGAYEDRLRRGGDLLLREASAYFAGGGTLRESLHRLVQRLTAEGIPYALFDGEPHAVLGCQMAPRERLNGHVHV